MFKLIGRLLLSFAFFIFLLIIFIHHAAATNVETIILDNFTEKQDMYPGIEIIKDRDMNLTIDDIITDSFANNFIPIHSIKQKKGFFETANWLRFKITNKSKENDWVLEFSFALINKIQIYMKENENIKLLYKSGSDLPFNQREIDHRYFVTHLKIEPGETYTFYALAVGSGDLHPPITIWNKETYIEKTQREFMLLGIFYGVTIVMILYNLFLYFSLRIKSYLYYVITITFTLLGKISINGVGFQYLWPNSPTWNLVSAPIWVSLACIFILIFSRSFLDTDHYIPSAKKVFYILMLLNCLVIVSLLFSRYVALYLMVIASLTTFLIVLTVAIICLKRGSTASKILRYRLAHFPNRCVGYYFGKNCCFAIYNHYGICWSNGINNRSCSVILSLS